MQRELAKLGIFDFTGFKGWYADGPVRLSHIDEAVEFGVAGNEERFKGTILPSSRLVRHSGTAAASTVSDGSKSVIVASADWRSRTTTKSLASNDDTELSRFAERLSEFGVCVDVACIGTTSRNPVENHVESSEFSRFGNSVQWYQVSKFTQTPSELQAALVREVPAALSRVAESDDHATYHEWPEESDRRNRQVRFWLSAVPVKQGGVNGLWRWPVKDKHYWLMQQVYGWRGALNASSVVMYLGGVNSGGMIVNLSAADRESLGPVVS